MGLFDRVSVVLIVSILSFLHRILWRYRTIDMYTVYRTFIPFYFISSRAVVEVARVVVGKASVSSICDIGSGSGYIAIELLKKYGELYGVAIDISREAVLVSKVNAKRFKVFDRIDIIQCRSGHCLRGSSIDVAISNPPYLPCPENWSRELCSGLGEHIYREIALQLIRISKRLAILSLSTLSRYSRLLVAHLKGIEVYRRRAGLDEVKIYLLKKRPQHP